MAEQTNGGNHRNILDFIEGVVGVVILLMLSGRLGFWFGSL